MSVYELRARTFSRGAPERQTCSKIFGDHTVLQLDGVTLYLKRDERISRLFYFTGYNVLVCGFLCMYFYLLPNGVINNNNNN